MNARIIPTALFALLVAPVLVRAQNPWERQVVDYVQRTATALRRQGLEPTGAPRVGPMLVDESAWFSVTLRAGVSYAIVGACDNDCSGLDLALYSDAHNEVEAERGSAVPMVKVTPRETLQYRVKVTLTGCRLSPCWYGIGVYRQAATPPAP
ncbi:MAG TPA: hypothetical protein VH158_09415 [Gemmatimonadales bacterium]|jgi:hypothetical protein|nr:hypothetical protein [Gemmatimonadales bacterium]